MTALPSAENFIARIAEGGDLAVHSALAGLLYKKLSSRLKRRVTKAQLVKFVNALEDGANLDSSASVAKISTAVAVDLRSELDRSGLL